MLIDQVKMEILTRGEEVHVERRAIHHECGPIHTPPGKLQIVVPCVLPQEQFEVFVGDYGGGWVSWGIESGLLLKENSSLCTERGMDYVSILVSCDSFT